MSTHRADLIAFLNQRDIPAPEAVSLLIGTAGEILAHALLHHCTDHDEVQRTIDRAADEMRRVTGLGSGPNTH